MKAFYSWLCIALGTLFLIWEMFLVWRRNDPHWLAIAQATRQEVQDAPKTPSLPTRIAIPSINITLPIYGSQVKNNVWEDSAVGISYLLRSPKPGEVGNSILYGHNWPTLLGNLNKVKPGDAITISYDTSISKTFIVKYINTVAPSETFILKGTTDRRITLYTCTGFLDSKRLVVTAVLE